MRFMGLFWRLKKIAFLSMTIEILNEILNHNWDFLSFLFIMRALCDEQTNSLISYL